MNMTWIEYIKFYTAPKPVLTVVPKAAAVQADKKSRAWVSPIKHGSLQKAKVHLWNNYATGRKPSTGKFEVVAHFVRHMDTMEHELLAIRYPHDYGMVVRLRSTVCTEAEYAAWVLALNADTVRIDDKAA